MTECEQIQIAKVSGVAASMRVSLVRTGGFTGQRLSASVDTDELPQAQASEALTTLDRLASAPASQPSAGASQPRYRFSVSPGAADQVVVEISESQIPPELRPLVTELIRRARTENRPSGAGPESSGDGANGTV